MLLLNFFMFCLMATSSSADLAQSLKETLERADCIFRGIENPEFRRDEAGHIYLLGRTPNKSRYSSLEQKIYTSNEYWDNYNNARQHSFMKLDPKANELRILNITDTRGWGWPAAVAIDVTSSSFFDSAMRSKLDPKDRLPLLSDFKL